MIIKNYLTGPLQVNTYLVVDDTSKEGMIVDPGGYSNQLLEDIKKLNCDIKYIFLTHGHCDHIGGVESLSTVFPSAKILASRKEKEILENPQYNSSLDFLTQPISIKIQEENELKEGDIIELGEVKFKVLETPGHTPGGLSLYTDGTVFSGDTLFKLSVGRTDFYGGSWEKLLQSINEKLFTLPDETVVLPGHMESTTIGFEKKYNQFL